MPNQQRSDILESVSTEKVAEDDRTAGADGVADHPGFRFHIDVCRIGDIRRLGEQFLAQCSRSPVASDGFATFCPTKNMNQCR